MIDSEMNDGDVPVILRPIGYRPDEDGWTADFQLRGRRFHAGLLEAASADGSDRTKSNYQVAFYEFLDNGHMSQDPIALSSLISADDPEYAVTQAVVAFFVDNRRRFTVKG
jgi:hypothetical protein